MKINKKYLKYVIILLPFILSSTVIPNIVSQVSDILLILKSIIFLYAVIEYIKLKNVSKFDLSIFLYLSIWGISIFYNDAPVLECIKEVILLLSFLLLIR